MEKLVILFLFTITRRSIMAACVVKGSQKFHKPVEKNEFYFAVIAITSLVTEARAIMRLSVTKRFFSDRTLHIYEVVGH